MKTWRKSALVVSALAITVACVACAPAAGEGPSSEEATSSDASGRTAIVTPNTSWEKWWAEYPDQVNSFFEGADDVEENGKVHSHSLLYATTEMRGVSTRVPGSGSAETLGTICAACKSTTATELYNEMGVEGLTQPWAEYSDDIDWWDCALCHEGGEPGGELAVGGVIGLTLSSSLLSEIDPGEAVCGQCHSSPYMNGSAGATMTKLLSGELDMEGVDPYKYGTDPDAMMRAALEICDELPVDEATGIAQFMGGNPDVEAFQGSIHDSLGLTCVDCHMPTMTNEEGESFTSHNASSTPLENEAALEYCLTCHTDQGVESTDEMKQFILDAQANLREMELALIERQAVLKDLIAEATASGEADQAALEKARDNYTRSAWYLNWVESWADIRGAKVAHNPTNFPSYIERAAALVEEGIDLLS